MELNDPIAEDLESRGQWRRAARRWLVVMDSSSNDTFLELIAQRRAFCLSMASGMTPNRKIAGMKKLWILRKRGIKSLTPASS